MSVIRVLKRRGGISGVDWKPGKNEQTSVKLEFKWSHTYSSSLLIWWVLRVFTTPSVCWLRSVMYCQKRLTVACHWSGFGGTARAWEPDVETHGSFSPHSSTPKTIHSPEIGRKLTSNQRQSENQSYSLHGCQWMNKQLWTEHRKMTRLESVEQIPRVITQRSRSVSHLRGFAPPSCSPDARMPSFIAFLLLPLRARVACAYVCWRVGVHAVVEVVVMLSAEVPVCRHATLPPNRVRSSQYLRFFWLSNPFVAAIEMKEFETKLKDEFSLDSLLLWLKVSR